MDVVTKSDGGTIVVGTVLLATSITLTGYSFFGGALDRVLFPFVNTK